MVDEREEQVWGEDEYGYKQSLIIRGMYWEIQALKRAIQDKEVVAAIEREYEDFDREQQP